METFLACDGAPEVWNMFDLSYAPHLLYYSYVPIIVVGLFLSIFIIKKSGVSGRSLSLLGLTTFFSFWSLNIIAQWLTVPSSLNMFEWMITPILEIFIFIFAFYFVYSSVFSSKSRFLLKSLMSLVLLPILGLTPTIYNTAVFDTYNCEANLAFLIKYLFSVEILIILSIISISLFKYFKEKEQQERSKILIYGISTSLFLIIFWLSNFFGELAQTYEINLVGPIGLVIFMGLLTFLIVHFKAFDIKLLGAQALVWALVILIGSQFFFIQSNTNKILTTVTLIISAIMGLMIVRGVKKEVAQREKIERLAEDLKMSNKGQENLIHIMNHQIKGFLGIAKNIFAELLQSDDYGKMPEDSKPLLAKGLDSTTAGVNYVQEILKGSNAEKGTLAYDKQPMNIREIVSELLSEQKDIVEKAGLSFAADVKDGVYDFVGDRTHLKEAFKNLITNAIKYNDYTYSGKAVKVSLVQMGQEIIFSVSDTGIGIAEEDKPRMFTAGGIGKDSTKYNVESSGFGLAYVKGVSEAHGGKVNFKSNAPERGTTFYIKLPLARK